VSAAPCLGLALSCTVSEIVHGKWYPRRCGRQVRSETCDVYGGSLAFAMYGANVPCQCLMEWDETQHTRRTERNGKRQMRGVNKTGASNVAGASSKVL
jgi:hypothetical protein